MKRMFMTVALIMVPELALGYSAMIEPFHDWQRHAREHLNTTQRPAGTIAAGTSTSFFNTPVTTRRPRLHAADLPSTMREFR